jgi:hypothetical protein
LWCIFGVRFRLRFEVSAFSVRVDATAFLVRRIGAKLGIDKPKSGSDRDFHATPVPRVFAASKTVDVIAVAAVGDAHPASLFAFFAAAR